MKELKSKAMKRMLALGVTAANKRHPPPDGLMVNLVYETLRNGWHYQVEYVHDTRHEDKPYVIAYGFAPPCRFNARVADVFLKQLI